MKLSLLSSGIAAALALSAEAQSIILDNNYVIDAAEATITPQSVEFKLERDGAEVVQKVPVTKVARLDWPQPSELTEAQQDIILRKYDEAAKKARSVADIHRGWRDKPGSWYVPAATLLVEALLRGGKDAEADALLTEVKALQLTPAQQVGAKLMDALQQYRKKLVGPAFTQASELVKGTDDSQMLARIYTLLGDIQYERDNFREALDLYLQIPVFLGSQAAFLPNAELGAARCLLSLKRIQEAADSFARIAKRYKGTPQAEEAARLQTEALKAMGGGGAAAKPEEAAEPK